TLVKCIMGYYRADTGRVSVGGVEARIGSPRDAAAHGIGMVYQHFTLVDAMTVAENLELARRHLPFVFDWAAERAAVAKFMATMPFRLDPSRPVHTLAAGEKQKLEILKQLYLGSTIVILDEPTSVLTPSEADEVLGLLRGMVKEGRLTVLMISHKFREVMQFADEVTVLRRGRPAGRGRVADLTPDAMARMMVGDEPPRATGTRAARAPGDVVLRIDSLTAHDDLGMPAVSELRLEVRAGEIVGIAGVSGNGQKELMAALSGERTVDDADVVKLMGAAVGRLDAEQRRALGLAFVPEERLGRGAVPEMSLAENALLTAHRQGLLRGAFVRADAVRDYAQATIDEFNVKAGGPEAAARSLSGGNLQKFIVGREIRQAPKVMIAAQPTWGVDVGAAAQIRQALIDLRDAGVAVLVVSEELDELFEICDRLAVIAQGRLADARPVRETNAEEIGMLMSGAFIAAGAHSERTFSPAGAIGPG
ncbi:MAG TPA: ABC transporter ATP-binding protein, partial [Gemmatimonadaceae bacterium]|nr:ABC transporter ATP-binding protein [Gemmatimonadaceae bacterium]